jgi:hypothetical protein
MFEMVTQKFNHLLHIGGTGVAGVLASNMVSDFDPQHAISIVQVVAQSIIAIVTVFATLKKAFQKPVVAAPNEQ